MTTIRRAPPPDGALLSPSFSSAFSARYNMHQMLESPMPSPALPSIVPRHGKKPPKPPYLRRALRWILSMLKWVCGLGLVYWLLLTWGWKVQRSEEHRMSFPNDFDRSYEVDRSSDRPAPRVISDMPGAPRWMLFLPPQLAYPLKPSVYADVCQRSHSLSTRLRQSTLGSAKSQESQSYYARDPTFVDIGETTEYGQVHAVKANEGLASQKPLVNEHSKETKTKIGLASEEGTLCEKSLTYVLETTDAGLGKTLMGLWLSYGLAEKEGRAFFVDDSHWSYGRYTDLFKPPPQPSCHPPALNHRLPYPHQARHLLVSSATMGWTFGHAFLRHFQEARKDKPDMQESIFALARKGYNALFDLAEPDSAYSSARLSELDMQVRSKGGLVVGIHIRRGDRHPWEVQYEHSYTPLETYTKAADSFISHGSYHQSKHHPAAPTSEKKGKCISQIILASDDPDIYSMHELSNTSRAQSQISLANKAALDAALPTSVPHDPNNIFSKFVEGNVGWEGGFFPSIYWGLGNPSAGSVAARGLREEREDPPPSELSLKLRQLVARAYLLDLNILGQSDAVVCGVSSVSCRLLAVMMGWEKGILGGRWKNVDGKYGWRALEEERSRR
ncbi:MAG: hypothetical protein Q9191_001769 [Dirinaria sp. TL-2023a]